tara:strand:- start:143 stop:442 length:300 start_codon:yes stop_codon:yes gene_type:complete
LTTLLNGEQLNLALVYFETIFCEVLIDSLGGRSRTLDHQGRHLQLNFLQAVRVDVKFVLQILHDSSGLDFHVLGTFFFKDVNIDFHRSNHEGERQLFSW